MRYVPRPGVVLTKVCGASLLVPTREASEACPHIVRLPGLLALEWKALADGKKLEDLYRAHEIFKHISHEEAVKQLDAAMATLCEKGFLIAEE